MRLIGRLIKRHLPMFLTAVFFLCLETVSDLLQPTFMAHIVDDGVKNADTRRILLDGLIMLGVAAVGALGAVMRNVLAGRTSQRIGRELRGELYEKVQTLSFPNIDKLEPAGIITRITNDVTQIQSFINSCMRVLVKLPVTCIGAIVLLLLQTPKQAPVLSVILLVGAGLIFANMKLGYPRFARVQRKLDGLNDAGREFLSSVRVVKAFHAEEQEEARFLAASEQLAVASTSAARVMAVFGPLINLTVNFGIVLLLWKTGRDDAGQIGRLMASVNYMTQVLFALSHMTNLLNSSVRAGASAARVQEIFSEQPAVRAPEHPAPLIITGAVSFRRVTFSYAGAARPVLYGIDVSVPAGETLGVIGATGSGKSTLVNLIPRFYDVTDGSVCIDGRDVRGIDPAALCAAVAVAPQKAVLFTGSIAENLRWGDEHASDEQLYDVLKLAAADEFVRALPDGLDTLLGQGGVNLSGGQKQRLCIARALLRRPRILILDDCTSALDAGTERAVLTALRDSSGGRTTFFISQRVSSVRRADRILCLENGRVAGLGTHERLMETCAQYRAIYESQIGGAQDG